MQMTNFTMPTSSMKFVLKSVPGLADVRDLHGDGDGPEDPTQMSGDVRKKFQMTCFTTPNSSCSMKYALKSVPGLADVGVLHGDGDGPRTPPRCLERSEKSFK